MKPSTTSTFRTPRTSRGPRTRRSRVFVGMSGGVDSSVAAALLKEANFEVVGVFMKNWSNDEFTDCPWERDFQDAKDVADTLQIPLMSWNFEREYRAKVIEYFFAEYAAGRTPNPDVMCNKEIKFGLFLERALREGADYIATGHYARKIRIRSNQNKSDRIRSNSVDNSITFALAIPKDRHKDQTYFLYTLIDDQLKNVLFPLAELTKEQVRAKAHELGLPNAEKPDSQGICFVGEVNVVNLLKSRLPEKVGVIQTVDGETIGEHSGVWFHTVGQRHGLGVGGGIPYYVVDKKLKTNTLTVAPGSNHPALYSKKMNVSELLWRSSRRLEKVDVRIRHGGTLEPATVRLTGDGEAIVRFDHAQRAVTPGQAAVFYKNGPVLGGGVIV